MLQTDPQSLRQRLSASAGLENRFLHGVDARVAFADIVHLSALGGRTRELLGRSVLIRTKDQLTAALALIELDGVAGRLVVCPPDLPATHVPFVIGAAGVDAIVTDGDVSGESYAGANSIIPCSRELVPAEPDHGVPCQTEWILLTSGTTGLPKLVLHTLGSLTDAINGRLKPAPRFVWGTFYDIRRYGGLQVFLRAVLGGCSLVLSHADEPVADFLDRAGAVGVTHISGTPSHWRRALMSPAASRIEPHYVRLSGEIVDQAILDRLRIRYPQATIAHAFASTEAGVAFEVGDGLEGFPASVIEGAAGGVEIKVEQGSLRIRSPRTAAGYVGRGANQLPGSGGFVDTGDVVERRGSRYYFAGRGDGVINVGGTKVHPEEVEGVINRHPQVQMSLVRPRRNPITGALVVADVVLNAEAAAAGAERTELQGQILQLCRETLPRHKVPAAVHFDLALSPNGKMVRSHA